MNIELINVSKKYNNNIVLRNINIKLEPGIYGLIGPNGAGKSTLMNILSGMTKLTEGQVVIDDVEFLSDDFYSLLGYVPQAPALYLDLTCKEFLEYICIIKQAEKKEAKRVLKILNLADKEYSLIKNLSGGMKQRLSIAQALINHPQILLLDEPTTGLDPIERIRLKNILRSFSKDKVIIISTHIISDMDQLADKLIFLKNGQILIEETPIKLLENVSNHFYEIIVDEKELELFINNHTVTQISRFNNKYKISFYSYDKKNYKLKQNITLEEMYLYYYGKEFIKI